MWLLGREKQAEEDTRGQDRHISCSFTQPSILSKHLLCYDRTIVWSVVIIVALAYWFSKLIGVNAKSQELQPFLN